MKLESESQLWNALFETEEHGSTSETVAWLMSGPDSHFIQLLATYCERDQLVRLIGVSRQTLRQVLNAQFSPLRERVADGPWHRGVQRAMDELVDLRPDLQEAFSQEAANEDARVQQALVAMELSKVMERMAKEPTVCP